MSSSMFSIRGFNEFGVDGGPTVKALKPNYHVITNLISTNTRLEVPDFELKHLVAASIAFKGIGGLLFIFGSSLGAYLLLLHQIVASPIFYDIYNNGIDKDDIFGHVLKHSQSLAILGALLFFLGMKNLMPAKRPVKKAPKKKTV
ncbi:hypothetical protein ACHQM5_005697 [Ranunculus cassubicifolius]